MIKKIYLDFESRSQVDIWKTGAYRYAEDLSTEIICLAYACNDGPICVRQKGNSLLAIVPRLNQYIQEGWEFHAYNAYFERSIWHFKMVKQYGALPIPIKQWRCTMSKCLVCGLPGKLEKAALALNTKNRKDMVGNKLMLQLASTTGYIDPDKLKRLMEYCVQDVITEREIDTRLPDLSPDEQRTWFMDQYINDTGVNTDIKAVKNAARIIRDETKVLNDELYRLTGGVVNAGTKTAAIKRFMESKGLKLPNLQKQTIKDALKDTDGTNLRVLQLRQQLSLSSNAKYQSLIDSVSSDSRLRDILIYHGASTGRWSGKLFQLQNLVRPTITQKDIQSAIQLIKAVPLTFDLYYAPNVLSTLSSCIRGMLIPTKGYDMFTADFSAIEARVIMWLSGDKTGLEAFRSQDADPSVPDIYVLMARNIHRKKHLTKKDKTERELGKRAVLGCGFGMGIDKFQATCEKYGIKLDLNLAKTAVNSYRSTFGAVPTFWREVEDAARKTILTKNPHSYRRITWRMAGEFLTMQLPSGRLLYYVHPRVETDGNISYMTTDSVTKKFVRTSAWGGKLAENAVQATARDIMRDAMFRIIHAEYRILFTVHDELVFEAQKNTKTVEHALGLIKIIPVWALGCPINAECEKTDRYKK